MVDYPDLNLAAIQMLADRDLETRRYLSSLQEKMGMACVLSTDRCPVEGDALVRELLLENCWGGGI